MRIAKIIGSVTLSRCHESFTGASLRVAVPLTLSNLKHGTTEEIDTLVVYDELGAGLGSRIAISEGGEAAQPFRPHVKPVDAYNAAILDTLEI